MMRARTPTRASQLPPTICSHFHSRTAARRLSEGGGGAWAEAGVAGGAALAAVTGRAGPERGVSEPAMPSRAVTRSCKRAIVWPYRSWTERTSSRRERSCSSTGAPAWGSSAFGSACPERNAPQLVQKRLSASLA